MSKNNLGTVGQGGLIRFKAYTLVTGRAAYLVELENGCVCLSLSVRK